MRRLLLPLAIASLAPQCAGALVPVASFESNLSVEPVDEFRKSAAKTARSVPDAVSGMRYYSKKNFNLAVYYLRRALDSDGRNAHLYYCLANSYVHVGRHAEAIESYRRSYELEPFGTVSGFCRQALLAYNVALPAVELKAKGKFRPSYKEGRPFNKAWTGKQSSAQEPGANGSSVEADGESEEESAQEEPLPAVRVQTVREHHVSNATAMIRRQAADEKARKKQMSDCLSANVVQTGTSKANQIKAEAEERIRELYEGPVLYDSQGNARGRGVPFWHLNPMLQDSLKERAEQIRREADSRAQLELSMSSDKSSEYKKWYLDREGDIDYVADSLESQLRLSGSRSGVSLNPVGTGFYVRNYSTFKPKYPIPEAHHSVVRFVDRGFHDPESCTTGGSKVQPGRRLDVSSELISK